MPRECWKTEDEGDGVGLEKGARGAAGAEVLIEEKGDVGVGEGLEADDDGDALSEGIVLGLGLREAIAEKSNGGVGVQVTPPPSE